jgi:tetraacyldisaccharide 4'-kinase
VGRKAQSTADAWLAVISGSDRRLRAALARAALLPASWLYGGVVGAYRGLYRWGVLRTTTLPCRVIGVGNLTVGGTGKSTTVGWLAKRLSESGRRVAVLSYGYRPKGSARRSAADGRLPLGAPPRQRKALSLSHRAPSAERRAPERSDVTVVSDGQRVCVPVATSGDEPRMLADALPGVPVLIGPRRVDSGMRAVEEYGAELCVLDDAFQYWRLHKDLEIVLIDADVPLGYGHLLPRGLLRESPRALGRADVVLVMNAYRLAAERREALLARLTHLAPRALLLEGRHRPIGLRELFTGEVLPLAWLSGRGVVALSSLGNPDGFEQTLKELGARVVVSRRFRDHHGYTTDEAIVSCELRRAGSDEASPAAAVVTTAKDAPKLREALGSEGGSALGARRLGTEVLPTPSSELLAPSQERSNRGPVLVLEIDLELAGDGAARLDRLLGNPIERD